MEVQFEKNFMYGCSFQEGFWYHHAEPDYLMLVRWIPATGSTIPANATHKVRIGAIVVNDKREVVGLVDMTYYTNKDKLA